MKTAICLLAVLSVPVLAFPATIYVPDDYSTIQGAIDASVNGDTIIVKPGTYVENIDFKGKAITVTSDQGPDVTIIDGGQPVDPDFGSVVSFMSGEGPDSVLEGFNLTNGSGNLIGIYYRGGGICCVNSSSPTIVNNIISGNSADLQGGGVVCLNSSSPTIENNTINDNSSNFGGGIYLNNSSPKIGNNLFTGNSANQG
ncbi:MAG: right-handed parallel beta-helix repeat-containing protein, partial [Planctomycetota bacterium]